MKKALALVVFFIGMMQEQLVSVIILVHGSYATSESWCRPKGDFYEALSKEAQKRDERIVPFAWSGKLSDKARLQGAEALAKLIASYPANEKVTLIGHSHGGNVIILASIILYNPFEDEEFLQELVDSLHHTNKTLEEEDFTCELRKTRERFWQENNLTRRPSPLLIHAAYLLGTPVLPPPYVPNMKMIWRLFHCYSLGDTIQTGYGMLYDRLMPKQERLVNLRVTLDGADPNHYDMHHPSIAQFILSMPEELSENGFEAFTYRRDGHLQFRDGIAYYEATD